MNKYENVMVNMMIKMHFSLPIRGIGGKKCQPYEEGGEGIDWLWSVLTAKGLTMETPEEGVCQELGNRGLCMACLQAVGCWWKKRRMSNEEHEGADLAMKR